MKVQIVFKNWPVIIHTKKKKREKRTVERRRSLVNKTDSLLLFKQNTLGNEKGLSRAEDLYKY